MYGKSCINMRIFPKPVDFAIENGRSNSTCKIHRECIYFTAKHPTKHLIDISEDF